MGIKNFEEYLHEKKLEFRLSLDNDDRIDSAKNIAAETLRCCCSEFEEQCVVENFKEILNEAYGLV